MKTGGIVPGADPTNLNPRARRRFATVLLAAFLGLQTLADVPSLHALIHPDWNSPGHECVITLFAHSQIDSCSVAIIIVTKAPIAVVGAPPRPARISCRDEPLPPARGPPLVS